MSIRSLCFSLFLFSFAASAQTGNYFLSHFSPDEERFNIVCFNIVQDNRGVFYFATQAGILQFDGRNWDIIQTNGTIYSIASNESNEIYVAGSKGFGKIVRNDDGLEEYRSLFEQQDAEYIFQIVTMSNKIYFLSDRNLFSYDPVTNKTEVLPARDDMGSLISLNEIYGRVYVSTELKGLYDVTDGKYTKAFSSFGNSVSMIFSVRNDQNYLLGTDDSRIFICNEALELRELVLEDSAYAQASVLVNATWVNDDIMALGTLRGGVLFFNPSTGKTTEIINYNTGLPDNEVFAIMTDQNLNVWTAHAYGFTRIAPYLPFRSFRYYPGLKGNLLCAATYDEKVYVGTSLGLFVLNKEEFYDEITYYVEVPVGVSQQQDGRARESESEPELEKKESQKGGFFRFLKRKKSRNTGNEVDLATDQDSKSTGTSFRRERRTRKILRSAYFSYRKVEGIDAKISQLTHWPGKLIASGLGGVYEVRDASAQKIIENPIRFLYASVANSTLFVSTHDDKLLKFSYNNGVWNDQGLVEIAAPIQYIFEEGDKAAWFCGFDKVYRLEYDGKSNSIQTLTLNNPNFDKTIGLYVNEEVIIATPSGFYFYDRNSKTLAEGDTIRKPQAYFATAANLWFRDNHNWYTVGKSGGHENLQLLNLFSSLRFIDADKSSGALWVITGSNELLRFNSELARRNEVKYPLILKSIQNNDVLVVRHFLRINQDQSAVTVEVVKPDYIGTKYVEYRFFLKGLHKDWTEWSPINNIINFPYLPSGEYELSVQSRDIFGRINDLQPVSLNVEPPYWKQTWFYAAEFSVFVFLVLLSFRLSYRFIFISRILSLLSIIMFIEFIQTLAGEQFSSKSSPVIDFLIQVCVAFMILPVEGFLRRHLLQALARRNQYKTTEDEETQLADEEKAIAGTAVNEPETQ